MNLEAPVKQDPEAMRLAHRALTHYRAKTTDQAPETLSQPITAYTDPAQFQHETQALFKRLPLALALSIELPQPKTFRAMTVMGVPLVLVRGEGGQVRAFLNACRHRGAQLCKEGHGSMDRFVCPYHAWQYDLEGALTAVYGASTFGEVSARTHSLTELACAERAGLIWVALTPGVRFDIDEWLGDFIGPLEGLHLKEWHLYDQRELPGPGWKVAWEGYLEAYHHNTVHANTVGRFTIGNLSLHDTYGPHQRIVFGRRTLPELLEQPEDQWEPDLHIRRIHLGFPNLAISGVLGDHCMVSQVFPGPTPDTTLTRQTVLCASEPVTEAQKAATEAFSQVVLKAVRDEDYVIGAGVQAAIRTGANDAFTIGRNEPAVQHFHRMVTRYAGAAPGRAQAA
jgi:phenylpropionate dioxygenase-like ring-hydroxylating dioxygenase large terminal subunit